MISADVKAIIKATRNKRSGGGSVKDPETFLDVQTKAKYENGSP